MKFTYADDGDGESVFPANSTAVISITKQDNNIHYDLILKTLRGNFTSAITINCIHKMQRLK